MAGTDEGTFTGADGAEIFRRRWSPGAEPRGTVVIAHGASEHSGRYAHVAERLNRSGYDAWALDHRGHGRSDGDGALIDRMANAVADLGTVIGEARAELPAGRKLVLLGHSMGGCIALEYALRRPETIDELVLSAPVAALEAASRVELVAARVISAVAPGFGIYAIDAEGVSRDPQVVKDYEADPLNHHGKLPARTLAEMAGAIKTFPERLPSMTMPLLVMLGSGDTLVPPDAGRMVERLAGSADKTLIEYDGLYHEILNEPEQDKVMDDLVAWLDARA